MAMKILAIEIGERLIKVCETYMGSSARKASACATFQTPSGAVIDGEIQDAEAVATVIRDNLKKNNLRSRKVVFSIASTRIATREVTIPPVKDAKIKSLVEANASDYFPVDMSKYRITYSLQERKTMGPDAGNRLLVMAAPLTILESYFTLSVLLGFQVQALDYSGNSQYHLLEVIPNDGVTMYIDISSAYSITTVMQKSKLLMQRTFPSGIDEYVLAYLAGTEKPDSEFLAAIHDLSSEYYTPQFGDTTPAYELAEYLSRLIGNITRLVDYYNSSNWEMPIERLVLTGIGSRIVGLREAVAESTGMPVTVMQKLDKVGASNSLASVLPQYISCLGSAISPVDLVPERYRKKKKEKKKKESVSLGVTVFVMCILAVGGLSASAYLSYQDALTEKAKLTDEVAELEHAEIVYNNFISYNKAADDLRALDTLISSPNDALLGFIEELENRMPPEINVIAANCGTESIEMNITVTSKLAAAKVIQQLRTFETIGVITVGDLDEPEDDTGLTIVTFSVSCEYVTQSPDDTAQDQTDTTQDQTDTAQDQ